MRHDSHQREIEQLAYRLWEKSGKPRGHSRHFWDKAQQMLWHARARVREFRVVGDGERQG
jgi:hypothetical protein